MKTIDWIYQRPSCITCKKAQEYFSKNGLTIREQVNASKERKNEREALNLMKQVDCLLVAKGKNFLRIDLRNDPPGNQELLKLIMGPTGNLRAPTFRVGKMMFVGFNEEMYQQIG